MNAHALLNLLSELWIIDKYVLCTMSSDIYYNIGLCL